MSGYLGKEEWQLGGHGAAPSVLWDCASDIFPGPQSVQRNRFIKIHYFKIQKPSEPDSPEWFSLDEGSWKLRVAKYSLPPLTLWLLYYFYQGEKCLSATSHEWVLHQLTILFSLLCLLASISLKRLGSHISPSWVSIAGSYLGLEWSNGDFNSKIFVHTAAFFSSLASR